VRKPLLVLLGAALATSLVSVVPPSSAGVVPAASTQARVRSAVSAGSAAVAPAATIDWRTCGGDTALQCSTLDVPLDHADPAGQQITLALSRRVHTSSAADYQGVMLVNPGGPGGSGLALPRIADSVPGDVADDYDWIGFDPRGVGSSVPSLACAPRYFHADRKAYVPTTGRITAYWRKRSAAYATSCSHTAAGRLLLDHMRTTDTVADLESLRVALGQETISFYGFSYGTYIAQVYATLHPERVRRFVLDGVVDPTRVWYSSNLDQSVAFDKSMRAFWKWVARHDRRFHLGRRWRTVRVAYYTELKRLEHKPFRGRLGPDELNDAMLSAGYYVYGWRSTALAFSRLVRKGDGMAMLDMYRQGDAADPNGYSVYTATTCSDASWPTRWQTWRHATRRVDARHPFLAWANTWYAAPCFRWPSTAGPRVPVSGAALTTKILLVNETRDAATPFTGALTVRRLFPTASLVAGVGGTTHAGSLSGVACVDDTVAAYLQDGTVPTRVPGSSYDRGCPRVPVPSTFGRSGRGATGGLPADLRRVVMDAGTH
jgi:pimeloyl-ACP methyl ester carboxylesterase